MNEKPVEAMQEPSDPTECHSTPSQDEEAIPAEIPPHQATKRGENCEELFEEAIEDPSLSENSDQDSDPDRESSEQDSSRELERLRGELKNLQDQLALKDARLGQISAEFEEFNTLYPNTPLSSLGDRVWADVQRGIPVAAAHHVDGARLAGVISADDDDGVVFPDSCDSHFSAPSQTTSGASDRIFM